VENILWPHSSLYGLKIIKVSLLIKQSRSWWVRLFSWPWKPWIKYEWVDNPALPGKGQCFKMENTIVMREDDAVELEKQLVQQS